MAHSMVTEWAMSDLGVHWSDAERRSDDMVSLEVDRLLNQALCSAQDILEQHAALHVALAEALVKEETLDAKRIDEVVREVVERV